MTAIEVATDFPSFPPGFILGAATAAYQIEGAVAEDGRGRSIWDTFCEIPGRVADGSSGALACDHYHRYREDVALLRLAGMSAYRFSIGWPRIQPDGSGPANPAGIAFYDRLIDELLANDIVPMATLYHWDLPQALQDRGGWLERGTAQRFAEYAAIVGEHFADRVGYWAPVNEPNVVTVLGHAVGVHAPGSRLGLAALPVAHHLLVGHGLAVQALRSAGAARVGCANNHSPVWPASDRAEDQQAASSYDDLWNRSYADSILLGRYPDSYAERLAASAIGGDVTSDLAIIAQPLDFYGMNYYNPVRIGAPIDGREPLVPGLPFASLPIEGYPRTDFDWPVIPAGLHEVLLQLRDRYGNRLPPLHITENGASYADGPDGSGRVADTNRIGYLDGHLRAVHQAIADGVDVAGYFCWSLLDNFEWAAGYRQRFGLVHVDYQNLRRTPKDSFRWYAELIRRQG